MCMASDWLLLLFGTRLSSGGGIWVPLDEYYYGKMEGDPSYTEVKGEFRFKVSACD